MGDARSSSSNSRCSNSRKTAAEQSRRYCNLALTASTSVKVWSHLVEGSDLSHFLLAGSVAPGGEELRLAALLSSCCYPTGSPWNTWPAKKCVSEEKTGRLWHSGSVGWWMVEADVTSHMDVC
jgi:hypothetical protein